MRFMSFSETFINLDKYRKIPIIIIALCIFLMISPSSGSLLYNNGTVVSSTDIKDSLGSYHPDTERPSAVQFFYSSGCQSCKDVQEYMKTFERKHPDIQIEYHNLAYDSDNRELFTQYKREFQNFEISYPVIFIGNIGLTGSSDIIHNFELALLH